MLKVLVHPHGALPPGLSIPRFLLRLLLQLLSKSLLLSFVLIILATTRIPAVTAESIAFAQDPDDGLSIIDSPAPNSVLHAGSNTSIAIDVSAGNSGAFTYNSLEIYLVSATAATNVTISNSPQLLTQEPGSTVKHIDWPVPTCLQTGTYNLTLYESSTLTSNGTGFFAIMPLPVQVQNDRVPDDCTSLVNTLQTQPQATNPPPADLLSSYPSLVPSNISVSPLWMSVGNATRTTAATPTAVPTGGQIITVTAGDGDITVPISNLPGTIVIEPPGGAPPSPTTTNVSSGFTTIFKTVAPTATQTLTEIISMPVTVTFEETFVSTFTASGQTEEFTVTQTQTLISTVMVVQTQVSSPEQAGLLPVNAGTTTIPKLSVFTVSSILLGFFYVLRSSLAL